MLGLIAESLLIATLAPPADRNARLREQLRREDEDYLASRRSHRLEARR